MKYIKYFSSQGVMNQQKRVNRPSYESLSVNRGVHAFLTHRHHEDPLVASKYFMAVFHCRAKNGQKIGKGKNGHIAKVSKNTRKVSKKLTQRQQKRSCL